MKHLYLFILYLSIPSFLWSQDYKFGIVHNGGYSFSIGAVPNFNGNNVDISDMGFALMLPEGNVNITNLSTFNGRPWSITEVTAAQLSGLGLGDGTRDLFALNLPPGQTILSHNNGSAIILLSFELTNMPDSGLLEFLSNSDTIAIGLGGVADSFFNANIDNSSTQNYFGGFLSGLENFSLETLSIPETELNLNELKVFPNPASHIVSITSGTPILDVQLYDVLGKEISILLIDNSFSVNELSNGMYLLHITTDKGSITKHLIKK